MQRLIIDYVLEGDNRGYSFTTPTSHVNAEFLKLIWRHAMPRGQGWSATAYIGARSIKCIPLSKDRVAISEIVVTDKPDEIGRLGIRRAEITLMQSDTYTDYLDEKWESLPDDARKAAEDRFSTKLWRRIADVALPKMNTPSQIILAYPFKSASDWKIVEACVLKLATMQRVRQKWEQWTPFTTLALDYREESQIVAIPADKAAKIKPPKGVSIIEMKP